MKCEHNNIAYIDLLQVDGEPLYTVKCRDCKEYGTIELVEGKDNFGLLKEDIQELKNDSVQNHEQ
jgi:hypothetical protein